MSGRIRTLKPEILDDEKTAALADDEFRLFVALILLADDHGSFRANPRWLAGQVWWCATLSRDPREVLATLSRVGLVTLYEHGGQTYGTISNWSKHQKVDKPSMPRMPMIDSEGSRILTDISVRKGGTDSRVSRETLDKPRETPADTRETLDTDLRSPISDLDLDQKIPPTPPAVPRTAGSSVSRTNWKAHAEEVFGAYLEGWHRVVGGTRPPQLDEKRRKLVKKRMTEGISIEDLKRSAAGIWKSQWNVDNKQTAFELALRDRPHIERFMAFEEEPVEEDFEWRDPPPHDPDPPGTEYCSPPQDFLDSLAAMKASQDRLR